MWFSGYKVLVIQDEEHKLEICCKKKNTGKLLEVMEMSITLIVVVVSQVYAYAQTHQIICIKYMQFLCINYAFIKLFKK